MDEDSLYGESYAASGYTSVYEESPESYTPPRSDKFYRQTSEYHIQQAEDAVRALKYVVNGPGWKKVLTNKRGTMVYNKRGSMLDEKTTVYMGEHEIVGGHLVDNLNDTTSTTYMVMHALAGTKSRDLSLVEKIECASTGEIYFAATSVDNPKVPNIAGRIRAEIILNGWILESLSISPPRTRVTYVLQVNVNSWFPNFIVSTYMSRRPLVLCAVEDYLIKNDPPIMPINNTSQTSPKLSPKISPKTSNGIHDNEIVERKTPKRKISFKESEPIPEDINFTTFDSDTIYEESIQLSENHTYIDDNLLPLIPSDISSQVKSPKLAQRSIPVPPSSPQAISPKSMSITSSDIKQSLRQDRHHNSAINALFKLKTLASDLNGWEFHTEERGDVRFDEGINIERLGPNEFLTKLAMKSNFPISRRDLSTVSIIERDPETGTIWHASTSIVDPLIPENRRHVRANLDISGWQLRPRVDEEDLSTYLEITYIVDIDIKLESIPPSIIKNILLQPPLCVANIIEILKTMGHPPYVKNTTDSIISEEIDIKTFQYDLAMEIIGNGVTDIKTSKTMYPNGFDVSVAPEGLKIELLAPRYTDIRVTVPDELRFEIVNIRITTNPIRDCSIDSPAPSSTDGSEDNEMLVSDSADSTLVTKDSDIYERENFQLKHLKAVVTDPKVTITDQISQPSEESPELETQKLIEQNIFVNKNKEKQECPSEETSPPLPILPPKTTTIKSPQMLPTATIKPPQMLPPTTTIKPPPMLPKTTTIKPPPMLPKTTTIKPPQMLPTTTIKPPQMLPPTTTIKPPQMLPPTTTIKPPQMLPPTTTKPPQMLPKTTTTKPPQMLPKTTTIKPPQILPMTTTIKPPQMLPKITTTKPPQMLPPTTTIKPSQMLPITISPPTSPTTTIKPSQMLPITISPPTSPTTIKPLQPKTTTKSPTVIKQPILPPTTIAPPPPIHHQQQQPHQL
ncbi:21156_t:CDS:2 [Cetraspora pellucida]|uniref:21156_t:CDS:1 n=1 Tax=Cetraspora pellucida TaxID=1433469 RepID=A0A9N8VPQ3_9GLOM|nr:21156_t:CDS:2 [Cetraspora pellucida]